MGLEWANAIGQGIAGAAKTGADIIDKQMQQTAQMEADQRAADRKLDTATRLAAAQEAMQNRAAERASGVIKAKMGEEIPMESAPVEKTGVTRAAAAEAGWSGGGLELDSAGLADLKKKASDTLGNPAATPAQKEDAKILLELLAEQEGGQAKLNAKAVDGKTRKRTLDEATDAARETLLQTDAPGFKALTGMLAAAGKSKAEQSKLEARREEMELKAKIEREKIAQRDTDSVRDNETAQARIKAIADRAAAAGIGGGKKSAMIQNIEFMTSVLKYTPEQIDAYVFEKKGISEKELAAKILSKDKYGEMTVAEAADKARELSAAFDVSPSAAPSAAAAPASGPKRLKWNPSTGKLE